MYPEYHRHPLRQAVKGALLLLTLAGATCGQVSLAFADSNTAQVAHHYQIQAGALDHALGDFAAAAGVSVTVPPALVAGKNSQGLSGNYTVQQGFDALLAGSGLQALEGGKGVFVLQKANALNRDKSASASTLPEVSVSAKAERSAVTEGSGSYAAKAVTIGKTEQTLREIPQSVSVMTRQQMNDQNFTTVAEALNQVTGVRGYNYEREENFIIRGYTANTQFNGVPQQGDSNHYDLALYDRIEVLRGPSGLLTGSGEPGGTINYVLKRPQDTFTLSAATGLGSWNQQRGELDVGGPLNTDGSLRGRAVAVYQDQDKFYHIGTDRNKVLYGVLEYDLGPSTTAGLWASYIERDYKNFWGLPLYSDGSLPSRSSYVGIDKNSHKQDKNIAFDIKHKFDNGWVAKGVLSYKNSQYHGFGVYGYDVIDASTGLGDAGVGFLNFENTWHSMDVNLSGPIALFGQTHTLTVGYNRATRDDVIGYQYETASNVAPLLTHNWDGVLNRNILSKSQTYTEQSGLYVSAKIKLLEPLSLILGGRWSDYSTKDRTSWPSKTAWQKSDADTNNEFTPYAGVVWDINQQITWYASYADTFVPQTQRNSSDRVLDPRVGWQVETGLKGEFFDGKLNASAALFRIRDKNRAIVDTTVAGCANSSGECYRQAGEVQSQGVEFEVTGKPSANLNLSAGYTYNQATYLQDASVSSGTRFAADQIPRHMLKLWSQYRFDGSTLAGALNGLSVGAGLQAQSDMYTDYIRQGSYTIASAKLGYQINQHWDASLTVNNLFDRKYLQYPGYPGYYNIYGTPRNALLMVRWKY